MLIISNTYIRIIIHHHAKHMLHTAKTVIWLIEILSHHQPITNSRYDLVDGSINLLIFKWKKNYETWHAGWQHHDLFFPSFFFFTKKKKKRKLHHVCLYFIFYWFFLSYTVICLLAFSKSWTSFDSLLPYASNSVYSWSPVSVCIKGAVISTFIHPYF